MFLIIFEDGNKLVKKELDDDTKFACIDGYCDIIDLETLEEAAENDDKEGTLEWTQIVKKD